MLEETNLSARWHQLYHEAKQPIELHDNGIDRNAAVTFSYAQISKSDPILTWFSAAALGSHQVGKALNLVAWPLLSWMPSSREVYASFCDLNQEIHHNIVAQYRFSNEYGIGALSTLQQEFEEGRVSEHLVQSLNAYGEIKTNYQQIYKERFHQDMSGQANESMILHLVFSDPIMVDKAEEAAMLMTRHEQTMVNYRYFKSSFEGGMTLGVALQHSWVENLVTDMMGWGGPTIEGEYFSTTQVTWTDLEDRLQYFHSIFKKLKKVIEEDTSLQRLLSLLDECPSQTEIDERLDIQQEKAKEQNRPRGLVWSYLVQVFNPEEYRKNLTQADEPRVVELSL